MYSIRSHKFISVLKAHTKWHLCGPEWHGECFSSNLSMPPTDHTAVVGNGAGGPDPELGGICAAREVDGSIGSIAMTVASAADEECGSVSEYGGAGSAAIPMGLGTPRGDWGTGIPAAAAVGVVRLHMRITSS